jgi:long-chain acyl-CoA synthetase
MNLATIIDEHDAAKTALIIEGRLVTYGELRDEVARARTTLAELRLPRGGRVALASGNDLVFVVTLLAGVGAGLIVVPVNPSAPPAEIERKLQIAGAGTIVLGPAGAGLAGSLRDVRVLSSLDSVKGEAAPVVDVAPTDVAVLLFTAGTAGAPKAAMLTHANLTWMQDALIRHPGGGIGPHMVVYGALPASHIFGLNVVIGTTLRAGGTIVLVDGFDAAGALELIRRHRVTSVPGVPPMWKQWSELADAPADAFGTVERATSGAAALSVEVFERMRERFGVEVAEGYGLTETSPVVTTNVGTAVRAGSIGVPLAGVEVRLIDTDGDDALPGDSGEVWVRGPNVFAGYWNDKAATDAVLDADGWFHTGDVALADDDGHLYLVDRIKDLIIVSGFNVSPAEVEEALLLHPGVAGAVVVGERDEETGERVVAYVTSADGERVDPAELREFCAKHLARYKCPTVVNLVDELPVSAVGKVLRRQLREGGQGT